MIPASPLTIYSIIRAGWTWPFYIMTNLDRLIAKYRTLLRRERSAYHQMVVTSSDLTFIDDISPRDQRREELESIRRQIQEYGSRIEFELIAKYKRELASVEKQIRKVDDMVGRLSLMRKRATLLHKLQPSRIRSELSHKVSSQKGGQ